MVSVDHSSPPPPLILCPRRGYISYEFSVEEEESFERHYLSPFNFSKINVDEKKDLLCRMCQHKTITCDYWCDKCCVAYHKECLEYPDEIKVPYHPKHSLQYQTSDAYYSTHKCNCCGEDIRRLYYSCSICDFYLHTVCAIRENILSINYPKIHDHTLTYFPRKNSLTCDICSLGNDKCFLYTCNQCDYVVHKSCIYLPTTIRISRHEHRISFTPYLYIPSKVDKDLSCGVCRKVVVENYGRYSCVKDCNYVVHPKCATRRDLWDRKELEGEPEIDYENMKAFQEISDGIIEHFSHPHHHMRLENQVNHIVDDERRCQAFISPIYEGSIYNCMKCDYILHETCAHIPRVKWHQLHAHPLTLQAVHENKGHTFGSKAFFICTACEMGCFGFAYTCCEPGCYFSLDVRCALVSEPFTYQVHPHPLFLAPEEGKSDTCDICGVYRYSLDYLSCSKCSLNLCFGCATIPNNVKYKHDEHFLTHFNDKVARVRIYCEICEEETCPKKGFYKCDVCNVTLHIECLLGREPFLKRGESIIIEKVTFLIISNKGLTRPVCSECRKHSLYKIAFTTLFGMLFCSMKCIFRFGEDRLTELDQQWKNSKELGKTENVNEL